MALNQATNITPSLSGAFSLGNGVVDAGKAMTVSWQVNGQSPMTAYQVTIYQNNAESTQLYTTGKVTLSTPFYGKDALGNFVFFSFSIAAATLAAAGITNGGNYKLSLRQWWGSTDAESILQSSAAAFITRADPTVSIDTIPTPVDERKYTFTATYTQAQGDALNWVRWQIAAAGDTDNPIYDSQNIYTALLSTTYDGFFSGNGPDIPNYSIRCVVQTVNGVEADTGWVPFTVYYETIRTAGLVKAECMKGKDAVLVSWPRISSIPGTASGGYVIRGGVLALEDGASVTWDIVNGESMAFPAPWTLLWKGTLVDIGYERPVFQVNTDGGVLSLEISGGFLTLLNNGVLISQHIMAYDGAETTLVLTENTAYWRVTHYGDDLLTPSNSLYPADDLYPNQGSVVTEKFSFPSEYDQTTIFGVTISGEQEADYFEIMDGMIVENDLRSAWIEGTYDPEFTVQTYFLADFSNGLNAGLASSGSGEIDGYTVYRQRGNERLLRAADVVGNVTQFYDYTIRNQQGPYRWSVYAKVGDSFVTEAIESNAVNPCFWDWVLLSCTEIEQDHFIVNRALRFGLNVSSGTMSNNNDPGIYKNFTRYPTIMRAPQNYKSGTLTALIGAIDHTGGKAEYSDTIALRDAIMELSTTNDRLFLRSRKGDLMEIQIAGAITMETMDAAASQPQNASIPWAEIGDASDVSLIAFDTV